MKITKKILRQIIKESIQEVEGVRSKRGDPSVPYYAVFNIDGSTFYLKGMFKKYEDAKDRLASEQEQSKGVYKIYKLSSPES